MLYNLFVDDMSMKTSSLSAVEGKFTRPSKEMIASQLEKLLQTIYDYYALNENGHTSADQQETMGKVSGYLNSVFSLLKSPGRQGATARGALSSRSGNDDECRVCLEEVAGRGYGLLKSCDHKYCQPCMRTLLDAPGHFLGLGLECPTCRVRSQQVILSDTFLLSGPQKEALFGSHVCVAHKDGTRRPVPRQNALIL